MEMATAQNIGSYESESPLQPKEGAATKSGGGGLQPGTHIPPLEAAGNTGINKEVIKSSEVDSGPNAAASTDSPVVERHEKAEMILEAHKERVETEANAYLQSEMRKADARAHTAQALAEQKKMHEEAKALEMKKREDLRAEHIKSNAEEKADKIMAKAKEEILKVAVKADKIVSNANQEAVRVRAHANEQTEHAIADAAIRAEREKAAEEEARKTQIAELVDRVEQMKATGALPISHEKKGVITRLKEKVTGH